MCWLSSEFFVYKYLWRIIIFRESCLYMNILSELKLRDNVSFQVTLNFKKREDLGWFNNSPFNAYNIEFKHFI